MTLTRHLAEILAEANEQAPGAFEAAMRYGEGRVGALHLGTKRGIVLVRRPMSGDSVWIERLNDNMHCYAESFYHCKDLKRVMKRAIKLAQEA